MELQEAKDYLRVDTSDDDTLIASLITAADQYLKESGCDESTNPELYALAQKLLISHWYENRGVVAVGTVTKTLEFSLQSLILSLKSYPSVDDGSATT
jgi:uncharacterized phage protein (predicted DNA packaging)